MLSSLIPFQNIYSAINTSLQGNEKGYSYFLSTRLNFVGNYHVPGGTSRMTSLLW